MTENRPRIVVVGFGPVAARFVDELRPAVASGAIELTVVGEEEHAAYNRVLVADLGVGRTSLASMSLADPAELAADGVRVLTSARATRLDRARRLVHLADGSARPYDRVVLATGARAVVPPLTGLNPDPLSPVLPPGVTALRDAHDAARLAEAVESRRRVIVLGGGVLGLEAALAASEEGATVTVVHHGDRPLSRSIDRAGGATLTAALRRRGVRVAGNARSTGLESGPDGAFRALLLEDGSAIDGDLLVIACGARPRVELAHGAGLAVGAGVLVDHTLGALATEHVFAIGDCAQVGEDAPSGLIAPGWRQADWLAAHFRHELLGDPAPEPLGNERASVILLKARGVNLAVAGEVTAEPWDEFEAESACAVHSSDARTGARAPLRVALWADPEHGAYVKMATRGGTLAGFVALGAPRAAAELTLLFESGAELPSDRSLILRLDGPDSHVSAGGVGTSAGPESTMCRCAGVSRSTVAEAVADGCSTLEDVSRQTRAGTGCGGCRDQVRELIERHCAAAA